MDDVSKDRHTRRYQIVGPAALLMDSAFPPLQERGARFCPLFGVSRIVFYKNEVGWSLVVYHFPFLTCGREVG